MESVGPTTAETSAARSQTRRAERVVSLHDRRDGATPARGAASVRVLLFGQPQLLVDGEHKQLAAPPRTWPLLGRLLSTGGVPVSRARIAADLWPDLPDSDGRVELRRHLYYLDSALERATANALRPTRSGSSLAIAPAPHLWVDLWAFANAEDDRLDAALALYTDDLLTPYDDAWIEEARETARRTRDDYVERNVATALQSGELERALRWSEFSLDLDAFSDRAVRRTMLLAARTGDRIGALRRYAGFEERLRDELAAHPEPATASLAASLRDFQNIVAPWTPRDIFPNNLPVSATPLFGRDDAITEILARFERARIVSLVGAPGIGKTRLACAVAERALADRHDGVFFVDLSDIGSDASVITRIVRALGIRIAPARDPLHALSAELRDRRILVILDNCERGLAGAASCAAELVRSCPQVAVLATSRERLHLDGEHVIDVAPLPIPAEGTQPSLAAALAIPSVALFAERYGTDARRANEVRVKLAETLAICRHVDGVPLALELVARSARHTSLAGLRASLQAGEGLDATSTAASGSGRWRSLRDAQTWSVAALDESARTLLARLSIFAADVGITTAAAVLGIPEDAIEHDLWRLADVSLVIAEPANPATFRFLAPMREHARELLRAEGDEPVWLERHAEHFVDQAVEAQRVFGTIPTTVWLRRIRAASSEFERVLERAKRGDVAREFAFRLIPPLRSWWYVDGPSTGLAWIATFEADARAAGDPLSIGSLLSAKSGLLLTLGAATASAAAAREAVRLLEPLGESRGLGVALRDHANALGLLGDREAEAVHRRSAEIFRSLGDSARLAQTLSQIGVEAYGRSDPEAARRSYEEAMALAQPIEELHTIASAAANLGELEYSLGNVARATALATEAILAFRQLGSDLVGVVLGNRSEYHLAAGRLDEARADFAAALEALARMRSRSWMALGMQAAAAIALAAGDAVAAATLLGFSAARVDELEIRREPVPERQFRELKEKLGVEDPRSGLGDPYHRGGHLSEDDALALARRITMARPAASR